MTSGHGIVNKIPVNVCGQLKWLILHYLPMSGSTSDVGGMLSATNIRKTVIESSVVIPMVTFSPESLGM